MKKPDTLLWRQPLTAIVTWAGKYPIIGTYGAGFWRIEGPNGEPPIFKKVTKPPVIQAENYDFGKVDIKDTTLYIQKIKISNLSSDTDLMINGFSDVNEPAFTNEFVWLDSMTHIKVKPLEYFELPVRFKPNEARKYKDSIVIFSNAIGQDSVIVIEGEGIDDTTTVDASGPINNIQIFKLYPQPATDEILIFFSLNSYTDIEKIKINIYDIFGNEIEEKDKISIEKFEGNIGIIKWDCTKILSGIYFIQVTYFSKNSYMKIIIFK